MVMKKTIGILGGLGPESTIAYYAYITRKYYERCNDYAYPDIIISSMSFQPFIEAGYDLPERVKEAIEGLRSAGADFVVASCNSLHIVYDRVSPVSAIPWVSIMDATAERIKEAGLHKVGLLGTMCTMSNDFYQRALAEHGITTITPAVAEQRKVNTIIFDELIRAIATDESRRFVLRCIEELRKNGAEGIVLGCTEIPFLIEQEHSSLPLFDTTAIHAQKALDLALQDGS